MPQPHHRLVAQIQLFFSNKPIVRLDWSTVILQLCLRATKPQELSTQLAGHILQSSRYRSLLTVQHIPVPEGQEAPQESVKQTHRLLLTMQHTIITWKPRINTRMSEAHHAACMLILRSSAHEVEAMACLEQKMSKYTQEKEAVANIMFFVPATWSRKTIMQARVRRERWRVAIIQDPLDLKSSEDARWFARGLRLRLTTCPRVEDIQHAKAEHEQGQHDMAPKIPAGTREHSCEMLRPISIKKLLCVLF